MRAVSAYRLLRQRVPDNSLNGRVPLHQRPGERFERDPPSPRNLSVGFPSDSHRPTPNRPPPACQEDLTSPFYEVFCETYRPENSFPQRPAGVIKMPAPSTVGKVAGQSGRGERGR